MAHQMSDRAVKLANALLKHQRQFRRDPKYVNQKAVEHAIITYKDLGTMAGTGWRDIGHLLRDIAEWCDEQGWPPLNALAVSSQTHEPSKEYDGAGNFKSVDWPYDVRKCIGFNRYPGKV